MIGQIRNKLKVVRYIGILAVALIALSVPTGAAFANDPPSDESSSDGVSYTSRGSSDNFLTQWFTGWFSIAGVKFSPSDCIQFPSDPHVVNYESVTSAIRASCRNAVPEMYHTATLKKREYSSSPWSFAASGQFRGTSVRLGSAFANADCEKMRYIVEGYGWVIDVDNELYYASSASGEVNNPCNYS